MNNQQARIRAHLEQLADEGHTEARTVDLFDQASLEHEGYLLSNLDRDLARIHEGTRD